MIDWQALKTNRFKKVNKEFNLHQKIEEIKEMMTFKAELLNLKLNFSTEFRK